MNKLTTFLRSKKLWIIVVLSIVSLVIIEPGRYTHPAISSNDFKLEVFGVNDSNGGRFHSENSQTHYDIIPGKFESVFASWTFLTSKNLALKVGVANWAKQDKKDAAEVVFNVHQNQQLLLTNFTARPGNSKTLYLKLDSGDVVSVEANKGLIHLEDIGFVELQEHRLFDTALIIIGVLAFWFVFVLILMDGFWLAIIPIFIGSTLIWLSIYNYDQQINAIQFIWSIAYFTFLTCLLSIIQLASNYWIRNGMHLLFMMIFIAISSVPYTIVLYTSVYGKPLEATDYFAFFQTDIAESLAYIRFTAPDWWLVALISLPLLFLPVFLIKRKPTQHIRIYLAAFSVLFVLVVITKKPLAFSLPAESYITYSQEVETFKEYLREFDESKEQLKVTTKKTNEVYFVIIGEAQSKFHMSQYGYVRPTTPRLDSLTHQKNTIVLNNAVSPHTHTAMSLSAALTLANQFNDLDYQKSPSIINVLNTAGIQTHWVSNQLKYGIWDNPVSAIAEQCKHQTFINLHIGESTETNNFDGALLDVIKGKLKKLDEGCHVYFIHLMGNHTEYKKRYPKEFVLFDNDNFKSLFGNLNPYKIDTYDNSMIYNDHVVAEIIELLDSIEVDEKAMFYFADHAEDLIEKHGHSSSLFNFRMIHIPSYFWFSNAYMNAHPDRLAGLNNNTSKTFTNDLAYEAILGMTGVTTKASSAENFNIFSSAYQLQDSSIKILNRINYTDSEHTLYHEVKNLKELALDSSIDFNVFPHRVNTRGMLYEMVAKGFKGIECDLVFNDTVFEVGHGGIEYMSGNSLEDYFSSSVGDSLDFIWLDLKNLRNDNTQIILQRLKFLDKTYGIKQRVLVESDTKSTAFAKFSEAGFNTSYYLPTDIAQESSSIKLRAHAIEIAKQIKLQKVHSISFDASLYPWVKQYLAPLISEHLQWHTWKLDLALEKTEFIDQMHAAPFVSDPRLNTVLIRVHSPYFL
ncbi:MAG: sulfatase-like hydrolase/transferase [Salibacteraceae bacterium]